MAEERVVIVGAGIAGLASAAALADDHRVIVLERGAIAAETTSRASGVISLPLEPIDPAALAVAREGFHRLDDTGIFTFTPAPAVRLAPAEVADAPPGGTAHNLDDLRARFPGVFGPLDGYRGGAVYGGCGLVDPLDLAMTLKHRAESAGATILRDRPVEDLLVEDGRVVGVETDLGRVGAHHVVYATGWRLRDQVSAHIEVPIRPLRWHALVVGHDIDGPIPIGSDPRLRVYWRPLGADRLLVGGNEHLVADPAGTPARVDSSFVETVQAELPRLLAVDAPLAVHRADCCPTADTASPDGVPIVDAPDEAPDGLVIATGFHGRGVMLSPLTGALVRAHVTDEGPPVSPDPYRLDRFADRSATFEYTSHWST